MSILVCFAVREEAEPFLRLARRDPAVVVRLTGIGQDNARRAIAAALAEERPALALSCGFAGGLRPDLGFGTVAFAADDDFPLRTALLEAGAVPGHFLCVERVLARAADKEAARRSSRADAAEMESGVIREVCRRRGIPSATVRVISDAAGEDLPLDFNACLKPDGRLDYLRLVLLLARSPGRLSRLLVLRRRARQAAANLAAVLNRVLAG